jgi:hypothetical protein
VDSLRAENPVKVNKKLSIPKLIDFFQGSQEIDSGSVNSGQHEEEVAESAKVESAEENPVSVENSGQTRKAVGFWGQEKYQVPKRG